MVEFEADDALASAAAAPRRIRGCAGGHLHAGQGPRPVRARHSRRAARPRAPGHARRRRRGGEKFGVRPASIPDYLALVGDAADGFPGLTGWGAKSTAAVLARWHHLEAIPDDHRDWQVDVARAGALAATLRRDRAQALLFRQLATLRTDVPLAE